MKGRILLPDTKETQWVQDILPGWSPAALPIAGRRYIDYAIEEARKEMVDVVEVLDWHFDQSLAKEYAELAPNVLPVFYHEGTGELPETRDDLARFSTPLTENLNEDISLVWGMRLRHHTLRSVHDWHEINFHLLSEGKLGFFTLPGYGYYHDNPKVHLGYDVTIGHQFSVSGAAILQDGTFVEDNVHLNNGCVIGRGSYISAGTTLSRTVIGDNVYLGPNLHFENKIVIGSRVIDARTGAYTDIEEPGVIRQLKPHFRWLDGLVRILGGTPRLRS